MNSARKLVVRTLTKVDDNNSYSNIVLSNALENSELSAQDKKFASALFYGVIERKLTLDEIIAHYSVNKHDKLSSEIRNILRCGIYQLLYMDSVPDNAAVDESVKLAKTNKNPASAGFVNALLREFVRRSKALPKRSSRVEQLCLEYSCPVWLVSKWLSEYGEKVCFDMLDTSFGQPPTTVRVNTVFAPLDDTLKLLSDEGIMFSRSKVLENCIDLYFSGSVEQTQAYKSGRIHVQDMSSQFCAAALDPRPSETVLDLCSAPGGKTFTIAEMMDNRGKVLAFDLHTNRVKLIQSGAHRLGLDCITAHTNDAKVFNEQIPKADKVLCDVPCSGLGVIRRKPEIKYKKPEDFERLPQIQYDILETSSKYVKQDGVLVYSTCTLSRTENDEVVDRFLKEHCEFSSCELGEAFGNDRHKSRLTFTPYKYDSDGFFVAKFRRIR